MVSIIRQSIKVSENSVLPQELISHILEKADLCSKIVKLSNNGISIFDFKSLKLIRNIKSNYLFKLSLSKCGNFVVGSNEHYPVHIWNINSGLKINIDIELEDEPTESPAHTFSLNNELLITHKNRIYSFEFSKEHKKWIVNHIYEIPEYSSIIYIEHNNSEHKFACVTTSRNIYILNSLTKTIETTLSEIDYYIISIMFNKHFIIVAGLHETCVFNLNNNNKILLQNPTLSSSFYIDQFFLMPCLTKVIGGSYHCSFIWDINTGHIIQNLNIKMNKYYTLTPGNTQIVSSDRDKRIKIVDLKDIM